MFVLERAPPFLERGFRKLVLAATVLLKIFVRVCFSTALLLLLLPSSAAALRIPLYLLTTSPPSRPVKLRQFWACIRASYRSSSDPSRSTLHHLLCGASEPVPRHLSSGQHPDLIGEGGVCQHTSKLYTTQQRTTSLRSSKLLCVNTDIFGSPIQFFLERHTQLQEPRLSNNPFRRP